MLQCKCGDTVQDWRGARGHVQFTGGGVHGEKMELPDDYKSLFSEVDDDADDQEADQEEQEADADAGDDQADQSPTETAERESGQSEAAESKGGSDGLGERLRLALTDDVRHLWGGA